MLHKPSHRRGFLRVAGLAGAGVLMAHEAFSVTEPEKKSEESGKEEVSPSEDLMREHGVLKRVLLIYDEGIRRLQKNEDVPPDALADSAKIIRDFIENYHEKLEENFLFPRFRKARTLVDLVDVLAKQHQAGRRLTDIVTRFATASSLKSAEERRQLIDALQQFNRMYSPHEAREDTVLFPALRKIISRNEYDSLGEDFEKQEHRLFGEDGFERMVDKVASIEKRLGIYDLSKFTPKI